jgi:hypothetical protein
MNIFEGHGKMITESTLASMSTEQKLELLHQMNKKFIELVDKVTSLTQK